MIGEIAARLSGGYMSGWTYPYASDLNLTKQAILIAAGQEPKELMERRIPVDFNAGKTKLEKPYELFEVPCKRVSAERAWISIPGKVQYIEEIKEYTDQAVRDVLPRATVNLGSDVDFPRNNVEKCGNVIAVSSSREIAIAAAEDAASNIFITLEPNNKKTDDFIAGLTQADEENFPPLAFAALSKSEMEGITGSILQNQSVEAAIPSFILEKYGTLIDWNYNTISQTAKKFDILRKNHPELDAKKFWNALMRGGLQAAVYFSDSQK